MPVDVAVIVVTYNSADHVGVLLDSVQPALGSLSYSVTVVDNGSTDGTLPHLQTRADCVVVPSHNDGYAAGVNRGVQHSPASAAVLVLNPDVELDPGSVPAMMAGLRRPEVGIVAPRVREADGRLSYSLRRRPALVRVGGLGFLRVPFLNERIEDPRFYDDERVVDWAMGAVLLVRRSCFDELGGMDESYFLYSEETDFSLRARDRGWETLYTPTAGAMHVGGGSGESIATHTMKAVNRVRLYRRRAGAVRAAVYYLLTVLIEVRRAVRWQGDSWPTVVALLRPSRRPPALRAGDALIPR